MLHHPEVTGLIEATVRRRLDEVSIYQATPRYLLQDHVFLLIGYGMNDPFDLALALEHNVRAFKDAARHHYALLRNTSDSDGIPGSKYVIDRWTSPILRVLR